jgi:nitroreductase
MDLTDVIARRYSVRAYKPDPVEEEKLQQILEAARMAPTAANRQPVQVIVIPTAGKQEALKRIYGRDWFSEAPLVLCVSGVEAEAWVRAQDGKSYVDVDAAIVMDHMVLTATSLGLGTCWIAAFDPDAAREVLGLPPGVSPILFTPLGYPADQARPKQRKGVDDLIKRHDW